MTVRVRMESLGSMCNARRQVLFSTQFKLAEKVPNRNGGLLLSSDAKINYKVAKHIAQHSAQVLNSDLVGDENEVTKGALNGGGRANPGFEYDAEESEFEKPRTQTNRVLDQARYDGP